MDSGKWTILPDYLKSITMTVRLAEQYISKDLMKISSRVTGANIMEQINIICTSTTVMKYYQIIITSHYFLKWKSTQSLQITQIINFGKCFHSYTTHSVSIMRTTRSQMLSTVGSRNPKSVLHNIYKSKYNVLFSALYISSVDFFLSHRKEVKAYAEMGRTTSIRRSV